MISISNQGSNTVSMSIRIDKDLKRQADTLFKKLGLNMSTAITMFLRQCEREQGLPFKATLEVPNTKLLQALEEAEQIRSGKIESKRIS